jgi:hypothetical protein
MGLSSRMIFRVYMRTNGHCGYCGKRLNMSLGPSEYHTSPDVPTVDHMQPVSRGGNSDLDNLMPCCSKCNQVKNNKTVEEYRAYLLKKMGAVFTPEQIEYLKQIGVELPPAPEIIFHFEIIEAMVKETVYD